MPGQSRADKYLIAEQVGKGSFGAANVVIHKETKEKYVLKRIRLARLSDWQRRSSFQELELVSSLDHPYIVPFVDGWVDRGHTINIVYGYCRNGDLGSLLQGQKGHFCEDRLKNWLAQTLLAMEYMHSAGVLHRDIKSSNLFLTGDYDIQIGDFGLATIRDDDSEPDYSVVGTPHYMSPELLSKQAYSFESDIWSLGCVMYELTALKPAFNAFNMHGLIHKIRKASLAPVPSQYSDEWCQIVKSMLRKSPSKRPSVQDLINAPCMREAVITAINRAKEINPDYYYVGLHDEVPVYWKRQLAPFTLETSLTSSTCTNAKINYSPRFSNSGERNGSRTSSHHDSKSSFTAPESKGDKNNNSRQSSQSQFTSLTPRPESRESQDPDSEQNTNPNDYQDDSDASRGVDEEDVEINSQLFCPKEKSKSIDWDGVAVNNSMTSEEDTEAHNSRYDKEQHSQKHQQTSSYHNSRDSEIEGSTDAIVIATMSSMEEEEDSMKGITNKKQDSNDKRYFPGHWSNPSHMSANIESRRVDGLQAIPEGSCEEMDSSVWKSLPMLSDRYVTSMSRNEDPTASGSEHGGCVHGMNGVESNSTTNIEEGSYQMDPKMSLISAGSFGYDISRRYEILEQTVTLCSQLYKKGRWAELGHMLLHISRDASPQMNEHHVSETHLSKKLEYHCGDRITFEEGRKMKNAVVKYYGPVAFAQGEWIGVEMEKPEGKHNGTVAGIPYFSCPKNHGLFIDPATLNNGLNKQKSK